MKKYVVPLFLAACLLLTACGPKAPDTAEPSAPPSAAPETTDAPTPEPTAEPTPEPTDGAKALSRWLRSAGKDTAETFIPDGLDTPMYTVPAAERNSEEIPAATDETRRVRVAADTELLESGILTAWLPAFETATGYIAEVYAGDASVLAAAAAAGEADVLLMKRTDASALGTMTHYPLRYELVSTIYSVI